MANSLRKLGGAVWWEGKKRFYSWRFPAAIYLSILLVVCILPPGACAFLNAHTSWLVVAVNTFLALFVLAGLLILPYSSLSAPYGSLEYQKERAGDIGTSLRLLARMFVNLIQSGLILGCGYLTMWGMEKFSDTSHSYFQLNISDSPPRVLMMYGLFAPMVYLALFLRQYKKYGQGQHVFPYIGAMLVAELVTKVIEDFQRTLRMERGIWSEGLWYLGVLLVIGLCFWRCRRLENEI